MSTRLAYIGVIIMWSTTPLAVKWSSEGAGYLFAATSRMVLGLLAAWLMLYAMRQSLPVHKRALITYLISGLNIFFSMTCLYWASQYIPSGWMSVLYGLSPIFTCVLATVLLGENALLPHKLFGMVLGLVGLALIFGQGYEAGLTSVIGIVVVLLGVISHSLSAVLVKRMRAGISGIAATTGGLAAATPLFLLSWFMLEGSMPEMITPRAIYSIIYLGALASTIGFAMYYHILTHMEVSKVSLITLITPVSALILGNLLNNEPLGLDILVGTGFIVTGLLLHEYGKKLVHYMFRIGGQLP